jgi:four helix bundle suffix protein
MTHGFIPKHGGYQTLLSYRKAEIVYDATVYFCDHFIDRRSRTHDQMIQAARSGKQNIVEGTMASATSKESEIKLLNVARASLEELLMDYKDFLRTHNHQLWDKNSKEAMAVRKLAYKRSKTNVSEQNSPSKTEAKSNSNTTYESYTTYKPYIETRPPETVSNIIICLIHQTNYLLDRQIRQLEKDFLKEGGLRERMTRARLQERNRKKT